MKKIILFALISCSSLFVFGQNWQIGLGLQTYPKVFSGVFVEGQHIIEVNNSFNTLTRIDLGYREQSTDHKALTLEIQRGFKLEINDNLYFEQALGLGLMNSFYSRRYWYENEWYNLIYTGSNAKTLDVIPSVTFGLGYRMKNTSNNDELWLRPKVFWQLPSNSPANPNFTLSMGYSRNF